MPFVVNMKKSSARAHIRPKLSQIVSIGLVEIAFPDNTENSPG
jgi:hypothetical protein